MWGGGQGVPNDWCIIILGIYWVSQKIFGMSLYVTYWVYERNFCIVIKIRVSAFERHVFNVILSKKKQI